jgi:hypothetical protein
VYQTLEHQCGPMTPINVHTWAQLQQLQRAQRCVRS